MREAIRHNKLKKAIEHGRIATGFHLNYGAPKIIELLGNLDFDFVYLDGEHGTLDTRDVEESCRAAELYDLTVICRVPQCDPNLISTYLNLGVQGIIVPHVDCRADAERAVDACFMEPLGHRPNGGSRSNRYWHGAADLPSAIGEVNRNISLSIQLESAESLANLDEILSVENVDYYTIGKRDLAQSLGFPRTPGPFPEQLTAKVKSMEERIRVRGGRMKDDVMRLERVNKFILDGGKKFLSR